MHTKFGLLIGLSALMHEAMFFTFHDYESQVICTENNHRKQRPMSGLLELITCLVYFHLTHGEELPPIIIEDVYVSSLQIRTGVDDSVSCCITRDHGTATHIKSI